VTGTPPTEHGPATGVLADLEIPAMVDAQLARFTPASLQAVESRRFHPGAALQTLRANHGAEVVAVDIGGDKLVTAPYAVDRGALVPQAAPVVKRSSAGVGYLEMLEEAARSAGGRGLPLGISYAGPVRGSRALAGINVTSFTEELRSRHDGDFARLSRQVSLVNDGEAGVLAASLDAIRHHPAARHVLYVINGSGLNAAAWRDGTVITCEAGHLPVDAGVNPLGQHKPCGMRGATWVCLESVAASKAGIEDLWLQRRGEALGGREIAAAFVAGDELAVRLYEGSALVTAHVVKGVAQALGILPEWDATVVVGHGGTFEVPGYGDRVRAILEQDLSRPTRMRFTKDFSANACLDGAAIAAVCAGAACAGDELARRPS
jgi:predicted NBD/HSP70 family sugar kinase